MIWSRQQKNREVLLDGNLEFLELEDYEPAVDRTFSIQKSLTIMLLFRPVSIRSADQKALKTKERNILYLIELLGS